MSYLVVRLFCFITFVTQVDCKDQAGTLVRKSNLILYSSNPSELPGASYRSLPSSSKSLRKIEHSKNTSIFKRMSILPCPDTRYNLAVVSKGKTTCCIHNYTLDSNHHAKFPQFEEPRWARKSVQSGIWRSRIRIGNCTRRPLKIAVD